MGRIVELRELPPKIVIEAFLSGSVGGLDSFGGLDGKGSMVVVDLERQEMIPVPDFEARVEAWRQAGGENPCPLNEMPTLSVLNSLVNHDGAFYDIDRHLIVNGV